MDSNLFNSNLGCQGALPFVTESGAGTGTGETGTPGIGTRSWANPRGACWQLRGVPIFGAPTWNDCPSVLWLAPNTVEEARVADGLAALQVVDATGLGLLLPREMVQSALDAFTSRLAENYPRGIHADSVQITDDGVTAHYSARDMSIPQGNQGNQGITDNQDPCFANL